MSITSCLRSSVPACAVVVVSLLALATPARAGQFVFERGARSVWAMNQDGSGARELVDVAQVSGMQEIDSASVQPNGTAIAFTGGWAGARHEEGRWNPFAVGYCGDGCLGYYELRSGALRRMTEGPGPCPGSQPCRVDESDARVAVDGSVVFSFQAAFGEQSFPGGPWSERSVEYQSRLRPAGGGTATKVVSPCASPLNILGTPAPNPTDPREVLYEGCLDSSNALESLARSGANPSNPGDDVGLVDDSGDFEGYDWRSDGKQIAFTDHGCNPAASSCGANGLQLADLGAADRPATSITYLLDSPSGTTFYSPRYVGAARIAFVAHGDIWTVPTSCRPSTCSFPASATRVTTARDVGPEIGYTTSTATIPALRSGSHSPRVTIKTRRTKVNAGRATVKLTCSGGACRGTLKLGLKQRIHRPIHGHRRTITKTLVLAHASYRLASGSARSITLRLTRAAQSLLRHARHHTLRVQASTSVRGGKTARGVVVLFLKR